MSNWQDVMGSAATAIVPPPQNMVRNSIPASHLCEHPPPFYCVCRAATRAAVVQPGSGSNNSRVVALQEGATRPTTDGERLNTLALRDYVSSSCTH